MEGQPHGLQELCAAAYDGHMPDKRIPLRGFAVGRRLRIDSAPAPPAPIEEDLAAAVTRAAEAVGASE